MPANLPICLKQEIRNHYFAFFKPYFVRRVLLHCSSSNIKASLWSFPSAPKRKLVFGEPRH